MMFLQVFFKELGQRFFFIKKFKFCQNNSSNNSRRSWFTWRWRLVSFFVDKNLSKISKKGTNIIWTSLRKKQFCKVSWVWLKNWACHMHFNFEHWMGVEGPTLELHPQSFGKSFTFRAGGSTKKLVGQLSSIARQLSKTGRAVYSKFHKKW